MSSVSPFDLVIFDCDGVLVDSEPLSCLAFEQVYANHGMKLPEGTVAKGIGMKQADIMKMIEDMTGHRLPEEATSQFWPETKILFAEALQPTVGIASFLRELPQKRCVASSSQPERIAFSLEKDRYQPLFRRCGLFVQHGQARQASAGPVPVRSRQNGCRSGALRGDRGLTLRCRRSHRGRHDGIRLYWRRTYLCRARRKIDGQGCASGFLALG